MVVNGQPSVLVAVGEEPPTLFTLEVRPGEELISQVLAVRNPDKLARIRAAK